MTSVFGTLTDPSIWGILVAAFCYYIFIALISIDSKPAFWFLVTLGVGVLFFHVAAVTIAIPVVKYMVKNPVYSVLFLVAYSIMGVIIALMKWRSYSKVEPYEFEAPPKNRLEEEERIREHYKRIPQASRHKSKISRWIGTWPVQIIDFVLTTMLRGFFKTIAEKSEYLFNRVTFNTNKELIEKYNELDKAEKQEISLRVNK